jgi:4-amino-4-deoxy-L-arabinose transferase-like glycosyltransferase
MISRVNRAFIACLAAGLVLRLLILWYAADIGLRIGDEQHYGQLAENLVRGKGFASATGQLTSLRPPLYPAFVAGVWTVFGVENLQALRLLQTGLAFITALLTYELGRRAFGPGVGRWAAAITWLYPSLIFVNVVMLGETLFTLLLVAFVLLAVMLVHRPSGWSAVACGLALGLGALTRSVLWPVPLVLCPLLVAIVGGPIRHRLALAGLVLAGYAAVVAPWAVRNTRLQGVVTIVDTMGGMNLRMGNYEHTLEDRMWDTVSLTGAENWA